MQLSPHVAHVWSARLDLSLSHTKQLHDALSQDEMERALRLRHPIVQRRWLAARGILRYILSRYINCPPKEIRFTCNAYQKPQLVSVKPTLQFNISHTENRMVCGITQHCPIGIDIEKIRPIRVMALAKRYFNKEETAILHTLAGNERETAFYGIWSRKEALLKAMGLGLSIPLHQVKVSAQNIQETIVMAGQPFIILPLACETGYAGALATGPVIQKLLDFHFEKEILIP